MNKYQIFTILFGLCLVIAGYFFFLLYEENAELKLQVLELNQEIYDLKERQLASGYELEYRDDWTDARIIRVDPLTGTREILVESIKEALPELQEDDNYTLAEIAFPKYSSKLYFAEVIADTDAPPLKCFSFDVNTKKFEEMKISKDYTGFGARILSPDKKKILAAPDTEDEEELGLSQSLKLLELEEDKSSIVLTLTGNETFNAGHGALSSEFDIRWINNDTIEYSVYDQSKARTLDIKPLTEKRRITL